jgi:hypothetical protein
MTNNSSMYGTFNARWLTPEDVARTFVPTTHFKALVRLQNSLLMGPRGCGKTTLLKMLTRPAQRVWRNERVFGDPSLAEYPSPDFEAVYIPSDVRWSYELASIQRELKADQGLAEAVQRASISISAVVEATKTFQRILEDDVATRPLMKSLIEHFGLGPTVPTFPEIRLKLLSWAETINSFVASRKSEKLRSHIDSLPHVLTGHSLDALFRACALFDEYCSQHSPSRWALCFDELEIAPLWLQRELMRALRSVDQKFLLKLTWSPILPTDLLDHQERQHDYSTIRMWHSHASEARPFALQFSTQLLRHRLNSPDITPRDVFGTSPFSQDDRNESLVEAYAPGSGAWKAMRSLAAKDQSFREYLKDHHIDPTNPTSHSTKVHDEVLRKVKPLVLLRDAYLKEESGSLYRRSRKTPAIYYGEDSIYAMSEGNPRLLAGLLNELIDSETRKSTVGIQISVEVQNKVLLAASYRTEAGIKTYPVESGGSKFSLGKLVDYLGGYLQSELLGRNFSGDPVGSFIVDNETHPQVVESIRLGLLIGALVYVGSSSGDIPSDVVGSRIRLSHMLVPLYKLVFRNYRPTRLSTAMRIVSSSQRSMLWAE